MVCQAGCDPWRTTSRPQLPDLSQPQATVWAMGSLGMGLARSCALTAVGHLLAKGLRRTEPTGRQPRRAWDDDTPRKRGAKRQALHVETGCAPLRGGMVRGWQGTPRAWALEAPTLGARFVGWALSVVERGWAIPVAWGSLPAGATHAWRREGLQRLRRRPRALPRGWTVRVLAARGLEAPWLLRRLTRRGGHPCVRLNPGGSVRPTGAPWWRPLPTVAPRPGTRGRGTGLALTRHQVAGTVLARWAEGDKAPWLILPALPPEASAAGW